MSATAHDHGRVGIAAEPTSLVGPGDYRCEECGYGVSVVRALPRCPMCGGADWESAPRVRVRRMHIETELERSAQTVTASIVSSHPSLR
jgi:rubredoxin